MTKKVKVYGFIAGALVLAASAFTASAAHKRANYKQDQVTYPGPAGKVVQVGDGPDGMIKDGKPVGKGWKSLFDGKTLKGWVYEPGYWEVKDGAIVGDKKMDTPHHHYMFSDKDYSDFEMHIDFKMVGYNSGVCCRIHPASFDDVPGYQVDEGDGYFGCLWDEHHRQKKIIDYPTDMANKIMHYTGEVPHNNHCDTDWNHYYYRCVGHHITIFLNGVKTGEVDDAPHGDDPGGFLEGPVGFQLCHGANTVASFRNIYIKLLKPAMKGTAPSPPATADKVVP